LDPAWQTIFVRPQHRRVTFEVHDERYAMLLGSDLRRDGMFLELRRVLPEPGRTVAEVFYSDETRDFSFSAFHAEIPVEAIERLILEAKARLPQSSDV
jgi:hypothetical protein